MLTPICPWGMGKTRLTTKLPFPLWERVGKRVYIYCLVLKPSTVYPALPVRLLPLRCPLPASTRFAPVLFRPSPSAWFNDKTTEGFVFVLNIYPVQGGERLREGGRIEPGLRGAKRPQGRDSRVGEEISARSPVTKSGGSRVTWYFGTGHFCAAAPNGIAK